MLTDIGLVCAISAKFYTPRPELQSQLQELVKKLAFGVPEVGYKSVEIVQAYLLLSLWGCGAVERYEQDKTWLLLGMAIRSAILHSAIFRPHLTPCLTQNGYGLEPPSKNGCSISGHT